MSFIKKLILSLLFFLIFISIFLLFFIFPLFKDIKDLSQKILEMDIKLQSIEKREKAIYQFESIFNDQKEVILELENALVNKELPISFIEFLEKISHDLNVEIKISLLNVLKDSLSFRIQGEGTKENVLKFIEKMESSDYLVALDHLKISRKDFKNNILVFEFSFSVLSK